MYAQGMGEKFANIRPREAIRALEKDGWIVHEISGSHVQLKHSGKPGRVTVPSHASRDLPKPILKRILHQARLTNQEFFNLLRK